MNRLVMVALCGVVASCAAQQEKPAPQVTSKAGVSVAELLEKVGPRLHRKYIYGDDLNLSGKRLTVPAIDESTPPGDVETILQMAMRAEGLCLVPFAEGSPFVLVQFGAYGSKLGLPVLAPNDPIPAGDAMVTKLFALKKAKPRELHAAFINMVTYPQAILALDSLDLLLVTDYASNLRRFEKIVAACEGS